MKAIDVEELMAWARKQAPVITGGGRISWAITDPPTRRVRLEISVELHETSTDPETRVTARVYLAEPRCCTPETYIGPNRLNPCSYHYNCECGPIAERRLA
jgi:hypothetical protein